jgi:hypothetical protein
LLSGAAEWLRFFISGWVLLEVGRDRWARRVLPIMNLENAVETTDCPMSLRSETRMNTDDQSNTSFRAITPQVS